MVRRPYLSKSIEGLAEIFESHPSDRLVLEALAAELQHRRTQKAKTLASRVKTTLVQVSRVPDPPRPAVAGREVGPPAPNPGPLSGSPARERQQTLPFDPLTPMDQRPATPEELKAARSTEQRTVVASTVAPDPQHPKVPIDWIPLAGNTGGIPPASFEPAEPAAILDSWVALEVLSPQTFKNPEELVDGDRGRVALFADRRLPWEGGGENPGHGYRLFYHVILGAMRMDLAAEELLRAFGDTRVERPGTRDLAALAAITVDQQGRPVHERPVSACSFPWGFSQVVAGQLGELRNWPSVEKFLTEGLLKILTNQSEDGQVLSLTRGDIDRATEWLAESCSIPKELLVAPFFCLRLFRWHELRGGPEPMLLNSFFIEDLGVARRLVMDRSAGHTVNRYLVVERPSTQIDLLKDRSALEELVAPNRVPPARWPTRGGYSLDLMQQAAINLVMTECSSEEGLVGINGPPGTGKTTLLRDLVAAIVTARAEVLATFDDPEAAFTHRAQVARGGGRFGHLYEIHSRLRGFECLVASSNNKAVENISRELPEWKAISELFAPRYFRTTAEAVARPASEGTEEQEGAAWGLVAAILGNAANRVQFYKSAWRDPEDGLLTYLWAASGHQQTVRRMNPETGAETEVTPRVVLCERPPAGTLVALTDWRSERQRFLATVARSRKALDNLETTRQRLRRLHGLRKAGVGLEQTAQAVTLQHEKAATESREATAALESCRVGANTAQGQLAKTRAERPSLLARVFRTARWTAWRTAHSESLRKHQQAERAFADASETARRASERLQTAERQVVHINEQLRCNRAALDGLIGDLTARQHEMGPHFADAAFWRAEHDEFHRSVAWLTARVQALRDDTFKAAFELHRAFIDAAAKPIRNNIDALFSVLLGQGLNAEKAALLPSLWATLFLVVPVVSTTFASVHRMLSPLGPEEIGWLLIDEAGQAVPQAAVGAMMRARRTVVVGDPLQIQPVVTLPLPLVERICRQFGVSSQDWAAPWASSQALADRSSKYNAWIEQPEGDVRVGAPLLVHRRCAEPMFSISNRIAYGDQMVYATPNRSSAIREILGPSRWYHTFGGGDDKWCPEEGRVAVRLVNKLLDAGVGTPDLFLITPFRIVQFRLRELVCQRGYPAVRIAGPAARQWARDHIGTVHTVQGKEAEAVILVLGAPNPEQTGARTWATTTSNLLNVAVSRAKEALYVIGNHDLWSQHGNCRELASRLPVERA